MSWWMGRASCNNAWRVRMGEVVNSFSDGGRIASEGENEGAGGSFATDSAISHCTSSFRAVRARRARVDVEIREGR
jgi:hypothetical protein